MIAAEAHLNGVVAFSQTDFTEDLKKITILLLVMYSEEKQLVTSGGGTEVGQAAEERDALLTYKDLPDK